MFVHDESSFEPVLARGELTDETAALSLNLELCYAVAPDGELSLLPMGERQPTDPPDVRRLLLWKGTSVTAAGSVHGPPRAPFACGASLAVGRAEHRVAIFGQRRWVRSGAGPLRPSEPEPFDAVALSWDLAFGGAYEIPPGLDPSTGLPHPGGRVSYPDNPRGMGLYPDERAAAGQPLPQIERAGEPVHTPADRPRPGGLSPCAGMPTLRLDDDELRPAAGSGAADQLRHRWAERLGPRMLATAVRLQHHAPAPLIFPWLAPGTAVRLDGVGTEPLHLQSPAPPVRVSVRRGRHHDEIQGRLRYLHLDASRRELRASFGFAHRYDPAAPPHWIVVRPEEGLP